MPLENFSQDIVDTVREPLLMLDTTLRVHSANRAFYQTFQVSPEETEHHLIYELGNGQWDIPDLRRLLEDVVPKSLVFNDFELVHTFPIIGRRVMLLNARKLKAGNHGELLVLAMEDVTDRRHAEADLKAIETYAQNIVDTVREPLLILDATLRIHSANRAFYQTFQVSSEETEHHLIYELGNGQWDIPDLRRLLEDVVPLSSVFSDFELRHTFPVIGQRVMLLNARKLKAGNHGELLVLAMEDVTERRRAEEEVAKAAADLKAIETFSENIVDTVREPLLMLDTTLRVHSANRAFYQTFQVSAEETEHHLIYELGNGQWDIPDLRTLLEDIVPKNSVFSDFELEHTFPVIGRRVMLLNARQLKAGNHGELLVLAMEDVTERRRSEADLKAIETYAQNIVDTVREPLLILDATLRIHSANRAFYQTFQVSSEETEHHLIYELGNGQWDIPDLRRLLEDVVPKSSVFSDFELRHTFPVIGQRVMLLNARKLKAGNHGELLVLAMEDVTERRRAEEEVAKAAADLKAIETFSENIVDTVREPLLMLDTTLRVHSANRAFYQTFQVSAEETEHHLIYELGNGQWDIPDLRTLLEDIVPKNSVFSDFELEHTFPVIGRRVMLLNARQLKAGNHGELLVLAMEDVTERRRSEADLKAIETYAQNIVDTVREPLLILDATLRIHSANRAFYQTFQVSSEETEHHLIYELGNGQWDIPDLRRLLEDVVPLSSVFSDFELRHTFPVIGQRVMLLNARKLKAGNHGELLVLAMEDVTERRRAEEEVAKAAADLKAIETFSENIVDTVREPLLMLDTTLRVHSANRAFYQTFQVSAEETEHHLIYELGNGQWDIPDLRTLLEDIVPKNSVFSDFELEHTFPVIGRRVMLLNARQLKAGNHGELLVLAMEDVTERRRSEADLKAIETYAQNIVDTVREPLLILDATLRIHSANRAFYQTFQVSSEETEHHLIYELGNGQWDIPDLRRLLEDVVPKSSVFSDFELRHTFPVIGQRVMLLNARKLKAGNHGELLVLAMEDVTERRRAEEEVAKAAADLKAIETFSENIVDTVREPLLMLDTTLRVHSANRAFYQTFHVTMEETENRLVYELGNGQWDIPALRTLLEDIVPKNSVFSDFELEHTFPVIGRRVMLLNARQLKAGNHGELLVVAMEDVTERRHAEEEGAKAKETAEAANRTKSLFLANMSHELRTPLNAILGYSEMLQEEATDQGVQNFLPDLQKIHGAGKHLLSLINDILDLSKIEAGKMELYLETFSVPNLIEEVVGTIRPLVEANANTLRVHCPVDLGTMRADMTKVRQSLFNLLSNAAKFTKEGAISLEVSREISDDREWIWFRVSDTGIGMTPEQMVKLFQTFSQADTSTTRKFGGSGLGLALTRRFCQLMGGDVNVNSVAGESSTFTIKVPAIVSDLEHAEPETGTPTEPHVSATQPLRSIGQSLPSIGSSVLVIDDDATQRDLMRRFLTSEGFNVQTASNGEEGLRLARRHLPIAITLDVMMPGMDGWTVLSMLKADPAVSHIPVIMLTMIDDKKRGYALGAANYITKPTERKPLAQMLKKYSCPQPPCPVLLVEGVSATRQTMRTMLEKAGWSVTEADNSHDALECVMQNRPALVLLDLATAEMDGFEFAAELHRHEEWKSIPIVVLTAEDLTPDELRRLNGNVHSIVSKGDSSREELMHQVRDLISDWAPPVELNSHLAPAKIRKAKVTTNV